MDDSKNSTNTPKYIIKKNERSEICVDLIDLSRSITIDCEILEVSTEGIKRLGILSGNAILYLFTEISEYALNNYKRGSNNHRAENYINLTKKYIADNKSVSFEDMLYLFRNNVFVALEEIYLFSSADCCLKMAYCLKQTLSKNKTEDMVFGGISSFFRGNYTVPNQAGFAYFAYQSFVGEGNISEEYARQGKFIVDFMKSDKYLFMV
jgi:hypothetical protein